jgi:hypothetical protein
MKRRELTTEEQQWTNRLRSIWDAQKAARGFNQEDAKLEMGFKSQGAVSHYLSGFIPLNTDAKIKFAKFLRCKITDIDPSFPDVSSLSERELSIIEVMRKLPTDLQDRLLDTALSVSKLSQ